MQAGNGVMEIFVQRCKFCESDNCFFKHKIPLTRSNLDKFSSDLTGKPEKLTILSKREQKDVEPYGKKGHMKVLKSEGIREPPGTREQPGQYKKKTGEEIH